MTHPGAGVDLYWLPLGAGGHSVKYNGRAFEAVAAARAHRARADLYHSALELRAAGERFVIEMTPVRRGAPSDRGVVAVGDVGGSDTRCAAGGAASFRTSRRQSTVRGV
jgi:hypothetical protein